MGKVAFVVGDDVSTDVIYPGRYMATVLPTETPQFAFANDPALNTKLNAKLVPPGSVLVGGKNFGCGSSREQAVSCLKGWELTIVASDISRIFLQNSINLGLEHHHGARRRGLGGRRGRRRGRRRSSTGRPASRGTSSRSRRRGRRSSTPAGSSPSRASGCWRRRRRAEAGAAPRTRSGRRGARTGAPSRLRPLPDPSSRVSPASSFTCSTRVSTRRSAWRCFCSSRRPAPARFGRALGLP